jgi:hypothetical protein
MGGTRVKFFKHDLPPCQKGDSLWKPVLRGVVRFMFAGKPLLPVSSFTTMTGDLLSFKDWLEGEKFTHVALERNGVYWNLVYNTLQESMEVILANGRDIKNVPSRETDTKRL